MNQMMFEQMNQMAAQNKLIMEKIAAQSKLMMEQMGHQVTSAMYGADETTVDLGELGRGPHESAKTLFTEKRMK